MIRHACPPTSPLSPNVPDDGHAVHALLANLDGLSVPVALAYMGPGAGIAAFGALLAMVGVFVFMVVGFVWYPVQRLCAAARRRRGKQAAPEGGEPAKLEDRYSAPDRFLHRVAFATIPIQRALADLEDRIYAGRIANIEIERPVFIASLPRAGTTLLLETLCSSGAFVAHTYRHMPFLFIPLLWNAISRRFRLRGGGVERAHGDGLTIGYDSAEAFEEALWRAFHRNRYLPDRIPPWPDDGSASRDDAASEFDTFIKNHMRKLIALQVSQRQGQGQANSESGNAPRYISKNNGNLSRLTQITRLFPDATVLVPLRNPVDHAASLLRAHLRFEEVHAREPFTRRYMQDVGHFDFGANLRPIDFDHWLDRAPPEPADNANFWLTYWRAAFTHIHANANGNIVLVDYDGLCAEPAAHLERIARKTGLAERTILAPASGRFRAPTRYDAAALGMDEALSESAAEIHRELLPRCVD